MPLIQSYDSYCVQNMTNNSGGPAIHVSKIRACLSGNVIEISPSSIPHWSHLRFKFWKEKESFLERIFIVLNPAQGLPNTATIDRFHSIYQEGTSTEVCDLNICFLWYLLGALNFQRHKKDKGCNWVLWLGFGMEIGVGVWLGVAFGPGLKLGMWLVWDIDSRAVVTRVCVIEP